jgi:UDP-N-acetylglucosamine 4,6-dehydratase
LAVAPNLRHKIIGIRPGEKLHEQMIGVEDAPHTYAYKEHYKILPAIHNWSQDPERIGDGRLVHPDFTYSSDNNEEWMSSETLSAWVRQHKDKIGG